MDHGGGSGGGGRSSSRLRDRLARIFRPGTLLRSTCNTTASTCSSSTAIPGGTTGSSSRALLAAVARDSRDIDSFLASSRRDYVVGRTESFSTSVDRLRRRVAVVAPAPPSRFSLDAPPPPQFERDDKEKSPRDRLVRIDRQTARLKLLSNDPYGFSSSDDTNDVVFSSDGDEDLAGRPGGASKKLAAETFFSSSRSFSSDSSEFYATNKKKKTRTTTKASNNKIDKSPAAAPPNKYKKPPLPPSRTRTGKTTREQRPQRHRRTASSSCDTCGVREGFRPVVVSAAEEQLRKGFAVVKRSPDPYADFRSSMVEMIVGRQLFGERELERLLRSYLLLNAPRHHPVILQAFSDIWVVLHGG